MPTWRARGFCSRCAAIARRAHVRGVRPCAREEFRSASDRALHGPAMASENLVLQGEQDSPPCEVHMVRSFCLEHLSDQALLHAAPEAAAHDRTRTAVLLAHIAEIHARGLYAQAGFPSMYEYCVRELKLSDDAALKRLRAARVARTFPAIFPALEAGRLHLTAVVRLKPYLTDENAPELLALAEGRSKSELEQLLAERFPKA